VAVKKSRNTILLLRAYMVGSAFQTPTHTVWHLLYTGSASRWMWYASGHRRWISPPKFTLVFLRYVEVKRTHLHGLVGAVRCEWGRRGEGGPRRRQRAEGHAAASTHGQRGTPAHPTLCLFSRN
jgi:hypothetical protein